MIGVQTRHRNWGTIVFLIQWSVGERSLCVEAKGVTHSGAQRSENAGTSSRNAGENPAHRKTKGSAAMKIIRGLVGPKRMAKAELDGHMVNIP